MQIRPLTEQDAEHIAVWRYPPPYDIYNFTSWETMLARQEEFADPSIRAKQYAGVWAATGEFSALSNALVGASGTLIGFGQFFPLVGITRLGLGLRPDLCGHGIGLDFVKALIAEAKRRAPSHLIDLEVLAWNTRAYKVYEKAGFVYEQSYERLTPNGTAKFHCMVYQ